VITVIAYGQHYLNRTHPWLKHVNAGLYPFYILHQTVIIMVGFYICQLPWSISAKFWAVSFLTLITCLIIYFLIRPFRWTRVLFGMKNKKIGRASHLPEISDAKETQYPFRKQP
jgi:surface polysaccharide O-acyltransferase-like enzyme